MKAGLLGVIASGVLLTVLSCTQTNVTPVDSSGETAGGTMTMKDDNSLWSAVSTSATLISGDIIQITGTDCSGSQIVIQVINPTNTGMYANQYASVSYVDPSATGIRITFQGSASISGTVAITEINPVAQTISGTFTSVVRNPITPGIWVEKDINLTEGQFSNIPYFTPAKGVTNYFTATAANDSVKASTTDGSVVDGGMVNGFVTIFVFAHSKSFVVMLNHPKPGVYNFDEQNYTALYYPNFPASTEYFLSVDGSLTITKFDTVQYRLEGSFASNATNYYGATPIPLSGSFGLTYH